METFTCPQCGKKMKRGGGSSAHMRWHNKAGVTASTPAFPTNPLPPRDRSKETYAANGGFVMTIRQIRTLADNVGGMKKLGELVEALV